MPLANQARHLRHDGRALVFGNLADHADVQTPVEIRRERVPLEVVHDVRLHDELVLTQVGIGACDQVA